MITLMPSGASDNVLFSMSQFTTAFPVGPAYGTMTSTTWSAFTALIRRRRQGAKDGPNFIPATFRLEPGGQVRRLAVNLLKRTAIALDIETSKLTGEVPPSLAEAADRIKAQGWTAALYTSHSHRPEAPRYRIVLPMSAEIAYDLPVVEVVAEQLGVRGVLDESKIGAASLFYLPSTDPNQLTHHETTVVDGTPIAAEWVQEQAGLLRATREVERNRQRAEALEAATKRREDRARRGFGNDTSIIEAIRDRLDMAVELTGHGYQPAGERRYLYPGSQTGVPGVHVLIGRDGIERVFSHHSGDPLASSNLPSWCGAKALDVVDVVTILDFGSDQTAALRTLAERFAIGDQRTARPEPPDEPTQKNSVALWPPLDTSIATRDLLPPPALPLTGVFPSAWATWITRAAEMKGSPAGYIATALLTVAGSLIGNSRWSEPWDGWAEPPVIFAGLVGLPSTNKSPALDALVQPVMEIEAAHNEDWQERRRGHTGDAVAAKLRREGWEKAVRAAVEAGKPTPTMAADAAEPDPVQRHRIASTDPTVAKAERLSAANPRGLILLRDELAGWIAGMDRYSGGGDRQFWLQAHGGRPWTPDRVKDGDHEIAVPHLTWGIIGGIQPDRLASLLLAGDDDGLAARFIYCWPDAGEPRRPSVGPGLAEAREWLMRLRELPWTPPEPLLIPFSEAARVIVQKWREAAAEMEKGATGLLLSWIGKLPGLAIRLALIFAHLEWCTRGLGDPPSEVTEADVLRAVAFLSDYAVPMARRSFGEAALPQAERDSRRLARWMLRQMPRAEVLNARNLRRMADDPGIPDAARIEAALHELAELDWVRPAEPNRAGLGGRSRSDWIVHPEIGDLDDVA